MFVSVILNGSSADFLVVGHECGAAETERCLGVLILVLWSSQLPHSKKLPGLIGPFYFVHGRVFPGQSGFLPQTRNMYIRLIGDSKVPLGMSV